MNLDPLDAYYAECRVAPVPESLLVQPLPLPWWVRLLIPLGGLGFGGLVAILLVLSPHSDSQQAGAQAAEAVSRAQLGLVMRGSEQIEPVRGKSHVRFLNGSQLSVAAGWLVPASEAHITIHATSSRQLGTSARTIRRLQVLRMLSRAPGGSRWIA